MSTFLPPKDLKQEVIRIFDEAENFIFIVSPYIKLGKTIKSVLNGKLSNPDLVIQILFGKNDEDKSKSLNTEDIEFLKQFKNIEIRYKENLHAKYYANERKSIITSLNLHSFSIQNNIEVGIMYESKLVGRILNKVNSSFAKDYNTDGDAFYYFSELYEKSQVFFSKHNEKSTKFLGLITRYSESSIELDITSEITKHSLDKKPQIKPQSGYCIRTGVQIPFNIKVPFSKPAYESWSKWKNKDFKEKYCHFSGEPSNGETSFTKPVLGKNYAAAIRLQKDLHH